VTRPYQSRPLTTWAPRLPFLVGGAAWPGQTRLGKAGPGRARQGGGSAGQGGAGPGKAWADPTG
jgi:hypothetical protein